ncbi:SIR2 family protein [Sulfuritalea sp.]|uniref:SIR2 family protein n=1 Tax=Sulfuritalea sp. TaxID=2480090 RepID=UPI00286DB90D|nr:SIR2 family protein [Sulfuritalea sp.]
MTSIAISKCVDRVKTAKNKARSKEFVALVGAGFSCNAHPQFPLWNEISQWVSDVFRDEPGLKPPKNVLGIEADDFTLAAEWYFYALGEKKIPLGKSAFIKAVDIRLTKYTNNRKLDLAAHAALVEKFDVIYTTNWDCLLEKSLKKSKIPYTRHLFDPTACKGHGKWESQISTPGRLARKDLIKYHGCCTDSGGTSIVASRTDYDMRMRRVVNVIGASSIAGDFDQRLGDAIPILIGYSYKDINVRFVLSQVNRSKSWRQKIRTLNVVVDNPAHFCDERLKFFRDVYGIETLFLFDKDSDYHKLRARWEAAHQLKDHGGSSGQCDKYKEAMTETSRQAFKEFFEAL